MVLDTETARERVMLRWGKRPVHECPLCGKEHRGVMRAAAQEVGKVIERARPGKGEFVPAGTGAKMKMGMGAKKGGVVVKPAAGRDVAGCARHSLRADPNCGQCQIVLGAVREGKK